MLKTNQNSRKVTKSFKKAYADQRSSPGEMLWKFAGIEIKWHITVELAITRGICKIPWQLAIILKVGRSGSTY